MVRSLLNVKIKVIEGIIGIIYNIIYLIYDNVNKCIRLDSSVILLKIV